MGNRSARAAVFVLVLLAVCFPELAIAAGDAAHGAVEADAHHTALGTRLPLWTCIPFVGILLSIALFPLVAPHFWHHHYPKVAAFWAIAFCVPFLGGYGREAFDSILHIYVADYIPFIILLWALFTISGGIVVRGTLRGSPIVNTGLLLIGTLLASWVGTTGAAMLLIRPLIRANGWRIHKTHLIVFFIFLVANVGGSLTPLGDPPLFLGFLHGVPFFWTLTLFPMYAFVSALLLIGFFFLDGFLYKKEPADAVEAMKAGETVPLSMAGLHNFGFLAGVVGFVLFSGMVKLGDLHLTAHLHLPIQNLVRDVGLIVLGIGAYKMTKASFREENSFSWGPIAEVAYLFAGIFMTIIPALEILKAGSGGALAWLVEGVNSDIRYFWVTGLLSSFLDNAPTYLTFFNTALGSLGAHGTEAEQVAALINATDGSLTEKTLLAISAGAVFMGANTYIGNAPNFMVKAIAEESGIAMPSFFGYIFRWSLPILVPCFVIVTFVFF
jgi:Na+/H+ antiporter NhaD/arsenite permease-like protein